MRAFAALIDKWLDTMDAKDILRAERDAERNMSYRQKAVRNTPSNHGWYTCPKCNGKFRLREMEADHILPRSHGGSDSVDNLQLLCRHCNRSKRADTSETKRDLRRRKRELKQQKREYIASLRDGFKQKRLKNEKSIAPAKKAFIREENNLPTDGVDGK